MKKNISIIVAATDEAQMKRIVKEATNTAAYYGQLQFVFCLKEQDSLCIEACHELYSKYPPDIFDPFPLPTIKFALDMDWCKEIADGGIIICENQDASFKYKHWDKLILETFDSYKDESESEECWEAVARLKTKLNLKSIEQKAVSV